MILYANSRRLVPAPHAGYCYGPVAFILESHRDDTGLRAHEQRHIDDFWIHPWRAFKGWLTKDRAWRLKSEVCAYAVQCLNENKPISVYKAAEFISTRYGLGISEHDAYILLRQQIEKMEKGLA
jgi:hypothetical protein